MSFLTGAASTNATQPTVYTGLQLQTSAQGVCIPLVWGKNRIAPNLIWYNNFESHQGSGKGGGGKGGQKGAGNCTYTAAVMLALCEGTIHGVEAVWTDQTEYFSGGLAKLGLSLATGTAGQGVWPYLTTSYPGEALAYAYTAYVYNASYSLGSSAALPNHNFEVAGVLAYSMASNGAPEGDANPADIVADFLTNPQYSIGLSPAVLDAASLAFYKTYCQAQGIFFSPALVAQEQVAQILDRWAALSNSWIFWSGAAFKFVPLGDSAIAANGATYTPNLTIAYDLTGDDFIFGDAGPIQVTRADPADCPSHVKIEIKDRGNAYNAAPCEWQDQALDGQFGPIDAGVSQAHEICELSIAAIVAQLIGQRGAYIRNTYAFKLGYEFSPLEPGDLVSLSDPHLGLDAVAVRIRTIDEDDSGVLAIVAEEFPGTIGTAL
jgi:hypothetical protein